MYKLIFHKKKSTLTFYVGCIVEQNQSKKEYEGCNDASV
jgi:hypothetical protein